MAQKANTVPPAQITQLPGHEESQDQPKPQKLSMKFLHERMNELQQENERLSQLVSELKRQWAEFHEARMEVAPAIDTPPQPLEEVEELALNLVKLEYRHELPQDNHVSRSERHAKKMKKKPALFQFLSLMIPFRTS